MMFERILFAGGVWGGVGLGEEWERKLFLLLFFYIIHYTADDGDDGNQALIS